MASDPDVESGAGLDAEPELDVACHINVVLADVAVDELAPALDQLRDLGYRRVVLPPLDPATTNAVELGRTLSGAGIAPVTIAGQTPDADVSSDDAGVRAAGAAALRAMVDFTVALGGDQMNGVPYGVFGHPSAPTSPDAFRFAAEGVGAAADYAHEHGVTMTFEVLNRYETSVVNTAAQALEFVEHSGSEHLRIHLDTFHMAVEEADLAGAIALAAPKLGYLELGQSGRGPLSTGAVDIAGLVGHAFDSGWTGRVGVEAFSRSVLAPVVSDMLAIWRSPYADGLDLAGDAIRVIRQGFAATVEGRRAAQPSHLPSGY